MPATSPEAVARKKVKERERKTERRREQRAAGGNKKPKVKVAAAVERIKPKMTIADRLRHTVKTEMSKSEQSAFLRAAVANTAAMPINEGEHNV